MSNSKGAFESIDEFLKKTSPWSYLVLGLAGFGIIMFFLLSSGNETVSNPKADNEPEEVSASATATPVDDIFQPLNGKSLTPREKEKGSSIYVIENNGDLDAIVKLIDVRTGLTYRHSYVHAKRKLELREIAPGSYLIKFATGRDFSKSRNTFTKDAVYFLSSQTTVFEEIIKDGSVSSTVDGAILFPREGGNVKVMTISEEEFRDKPEPDGKE